MNLLCKVPTELICENWQVGSCSAAVVSSGFGAASADIGGVSPYDVLREFARQSMDRAWRVCVLLARPGLRRPVRKRSRERERERERERRQQGSESERERVGEKEKEGGLRGKRESKRDRERKCVRVCVRVCGREGTRERDNRECILHEKLLEI